MSSRAPRVLRGLALLWLLVYLPAYSVTYGPLNFLFLCNLGVFLTAVGILAGSPLLVSSQAVSAMAICAVWCVDAGARLLTGEFPFGFTAYMWDPQYPLFTRLLSLYHVGWPLVLVVALRQLGYDPRGYPLQVGIAGLAMIAGRLADPELNLNFAHSDPFTGRSLGPAPLHLLVTLAALALVVYGATHRLLLATLPAVGAVRGER